MQAQLMASVCGVAAFGLAIGAVLAQPPAIGSGPKQKDPPSIEGDREPGRDDLNREWAALKYEVEALRQKADAFDKKMAQPRREQQKIVVTNPLVKNLVVARQYAGKIYGHRHINVLANVHGLLLEVPIREGQAVKQGDILFKTASTSYKHRLDAELAGVRVAEIELAQAKKPAVGKAASPQDVSLCEAKLTKAQASAKLAEYEWDSTTVRAPFDGFVGRLHVQEGSLVKEWDRVTTLTDDSQLWVYFDVSEIRYLEHKASRKEIVGTPAELVLADGRGSLEAGKLAAIDANEEGTGKFSFSFRADFPNPNRLLRHGQSGSVLLRDPLKDATVIPRRATFEENGRRYVYVVAKGDVVRRRAVDVRYEMDDILVTDGLDVGDRIVLEGVQQLREGDKVECEFRNPEAVLKGR